MARVAIRSEISGKVWKVEASPGAALAEGDAVVILESMKMEIPVEAPRAGRLAEILVGEGDAVIEDQVIAWLET